MLHSPIPSPNAAWARISFFAEYFKAKGHRVSIAGAFSSKSLGSAGSSKWMGIRILNITPIIMLSNVFAFFFNNISSIISSLVLIVILRPNIVIISLPNGETATGPYIAARLFRKKIVIDYRDEWEDYGIGLIT